MQIPRKYGIQCLREDELAVDRHKRPEGNTDIECHWESERSQHVVLQLADEWHPLRGDLVGTDEIIQQTNGEVNCL